MELYDVAAARCAGYEPDEVERALREALDAVSGLDWVEPGMTVAVKANLLAAKKPEEAATVHPAVAEALCRLLAARGARVVLGDSPGTPFTAANLSRFYAATGMRAVERAGAALNDDFSTQVVRFPQGKALREIPMTSYLCKADAVVSLGKLKTHGLMAYTGACKNLFGAVPGLTKSEFHFRFPERERFAEMLVDIDECLKPKLSLCDAVVAMEGNGPSSGRPRRLGALLASRSPYALDLLGAHLIGLAPQQVPVLKAAVLRGLVPGDLSALRVYGDVEGLTVRDFALPPLPDERSWLGGSAGLTSLASGLLAPRPQVRRGECVGCGECVRVCPARAIALSKGRAKIDRSRCIRCFCCQEFCPRGAIGIRGLLHRLG